MRRLALLVLIAIAIPLPSSAQMCVLSLMNDPHKDRVKSFASDLFDKRALMATNLLSALDNFEGTMQFASEFETEPRVAKALLETAISESVDFLVDAVAKKVPGTSQVAAAIKAVNAEVERAAAAAASHSVGSWIATQRTIIGDHLSGAQDGKETEAPLQTKSQIENAIIEDLCWFRENGGDLEAGIESILDAQVALGDVPSVETYERALYEDWLGANFHGFGGDDKTTGTVRVFWIVEVEGAPNDYDGPPYPLVWDADAWAAEVVLPESYGQRVAGGLNRLGVSPLEVRVVKEICFETDGIAGGTATYCGALQKDGSVRHEPTPPWARQMFEASVWRNGTAKFRE